MPLYTYTAWLWVPAAYDRHSGSGAKKKKRRYKCNLANTWSFYLFLYRCVVWCFCFYYFFWGVKVWRRRYVHRYVCRVLARFELWDVKCVIENGRPGLRCLFGDAHIVWLAAPFFCMKWDKTLSHFVIFKSPPHPTTGILKIKKKRLSKLLLGPSLTQSEKKKKTSRVSKKSSVPFDTYANETLSLSFLYIYFFVPPPLSLSFGIAI